MIWLGIAGCFLVSHSDGLISPHVTSIPKYRTSMVRATETKIEIPTTRTDRKLKNKNNNKKKRTPPQNRPQVTVRPGPGVSITSTDGNTIVMLDTDENKKTKKTDDKVTQRSTPQRAEKEKAASSPSDEKKSQSSEEGKNSNSDLDSTNDVGLSQRAAVATAALLRRNRGGVTGRSSGAKKKGATSVGARRVKGASIARQKGGSVTSSILGTVKTVAAAAASSSTSSQIQTDNNANNNNNNTTATTNSRQTSSPSTKKDGNSRKRPSKTVIDAVIQDSLDGQILSKKERNQSGGSDTTGMSMGILGEPVDVGPQPHMVQEPLPGSILLHPTLKRSSNRLKSGSMTVRVATEADDVDIANLRLSVFSDFAPEVRAHFCNRSCQVLANRRLRGATCLVATVPMTKMIGDDFVLGSAECSVHEFYGTQLGMSRPQDSALYITEVAVNPCARRIGVGHKLLEGVDELATIRGVETLYLHVDVTNVAALRLYDRAGYQQVDPQDPIFGEFTTKLNLHDGATKGRKHFLLFKDLTPNPTWINTGAVEQQNSQTSNCFGFDLQ
jgi:ribosomal protein S18 acetylase RimI-like enzyme